MKYYIDSVRTEATEISVLGWAISESPNIPVRITIIGPSGIKVAASYIHIHRFTVNQEFFAGKSDLDLGFCISFLYEKEKKYYIVFEADGKRIKRRIRND